MRDLTLDEAVSLHRKLWLEIEEEILKGWIKNMSDFFMEKVWISMEISGGESVQSSCFLCEYHKQTEMRLGLPEVRCRFCPLFEPKKQISCLGGYYDRFIASVEDRNLIKAAELAHKIASLPIVNRKGEEITS